MRPRQGTATSALRIGCANSRRKRRRGSASARPGGRSSSAPSCGRRRCLRPRSASAGSRRKSTPSSGPTIAPSSVSTRAVRRSRGRGQDRAGGRADHLPAEEAAGRARRGASAHRETARRRPRRARAGSAGQGEGGIADPGVARPGQAAGAGRPAMTTRAAGGAQPPTLARRPVLVRAVSAEPVTRGVRNCRSWGTKQSPGGAQARRAVARGQAQVSDCRLPSRLPAGWSTFHGALRTRCRRFPIAGTRAAPAASRPPLAVADRAFPSARRRPACASS